MGSNRWLLLAGLCAAAVAGCKRNSGAGANRDAAVVMASSSPEAGAPAGAGRDGAADAPMGSPPTPPTPSPGDGGVVTPTPTPGPAPGTPPAASASRVKVSFDDRLHRRLTWQPAASSVLVFEAAVQPGIRLGGQDVVDFTADRARSRTARVTDREFGPGEETIAVGVAERPDGVRVEREVRTLLPDRHPDAAVTRTVYRNVGAARLQVERVSGERLLLDRAQAEPGQPPHAFVSYQGAAYEWGKDYALIPLSPGFKQRNFMGQDDLAGPEGIGGGMPLVDLWGKVMGVAVAVVEPGPRWVSLPVAVRADGKVEVAVEETPQARLGQREWLAPGDSYETVTSAVLFHRGDFYAALAGYGELLRARGVAIPRESPPSAHAPYWKSWGFRRAVTVDKFLGVLPELAAMGIKQANLDDGWFDFMGDWQPSTAAGKFPGGGPDMVRFVERVHAAGFRTGIWWYPLGVHPDSRLARERRDLLVMDAAGGLPRDPNALHQLCPAHPPARQLIRDVLRRMIADWGFDGVYLDFQGLSAVPPCFNPAHKHATPLEGFEQLPKVFEEIHADLHQLEPDPYLEACVCALPHSPHIMPFYKVATTSDPQSDAQARRRLKAEKAIRGPRFAVGDGYQVPADEYRGVSLKEGFEAAMGTGAQLTTFYADLDARQRALWTRWFTEYQAQGPGTGEYLNLYDLAFDIPEGHVVRRGSDLYYGFFAERWPVQAIELRGLDRGTRYEVLDYGRGMSLGPVSGADPVIRAAFEGSLLLRVRPLPSN